MLQMMRIAFLEDAHRSEKLQQKESLGRIISSGTATASRPAW
jgi:hypothetical protein